MEGPYETTSFSNTVRQSQTQKLREMFALPVKKAKEERSNGNWEKILKAVTFEPPTEDFYIDMPVKPGFWFWKTLATAETGLETLKVAIPPTFIVLGNNAFYSLSYDRKTGRIVRRNEQETTLSEFEKSAYEQIDQRHAEEDYYFLVHRSPGRVENEVNKNVFTNFSWQSKRAMSSGVESPSMLQSYIYPRGYFASITRVCYKTSNSRETKSSYGFKLTNFQKLHDKASKKSISVKATICKDIENSFDVAPVFSGTVAFYQPMIESVVNFLQRVGGVCITEIVADFITDSNGQPMLFNVKALNTLPKATKLTRNLDELSCSVFCTLCGNTFRRDDARKLLTYKLLWEFERHLVKRGVKLTGVERAHNSTRPCKVCDLCYTVVVAEHKLIEYEQQFALAQNVRIKDLFVKVKSECKPKNRPHFVPAILRQWRLMLLVKELRLENSPETNSANFNIDSVPIHFQIKFGSAKFTFKAKLEQKKKEGESTVYQIKVLKVFYFFSIPNESIDAFLNETEIHFRLSDSDGPNCHFLAQGATRTTTTFKHNSYDGQKHESVVYLFSGDTVFAPMKIMVGLVSDGECDTASINLTRVQWVYFPDDDFYNCNILPGQWMEIFTDNSVEREDEEEPHNRPDFKITKNLTFLESVFEGKFEIQKSLLSCGLFKKRANSRPFSNISSLNTQPTACQGSQARTLSRVHLKMNCKENTLTSPKDITKKHISQKTEPVKFRLKSSVVSTTSDVVGQGKWALNHAREETLYREYLEAIGGERESRSNCVMNC